jgi:hypothetical protein
VLLRCRWLAEAGMVLRDPPAMHMLAAEVADTLHRCATLGVGVFVLLCHLLLSLCCGDGCVVRMLSKCDVRPTSHAHAGS